MTYNESVEYLTALCALGSRPGFERISALCVLLGSPEKSLKFVHVTGTNGKGSVSSMIEAILRAAGFMTGCYSSPHTEKYNERISVMGEDISDSDFASLLGEVKAVAQTMSDTPTEFEFLTAAAFLYFKKRGCEIVVLEVGMGGISDATNIVSAENVLLSVITRVSLDHTAYLGDTIEEIATCKAGIIKRGRPVLYGGEDECVREVIRKTADRHNAPFFEVGTAKDAGVNILSTSINGTDFTLVGYPQMLHIPQPGIYQAKNAATAVRAAMILRDICDIFLSDTAISEGISCKPSLRHGRFEVLCEEPLFIADAAHNPDGIAAAADTIRRIFGDKKIILITGVLRDKDYGTMIGIIKPLCAYVLTVTPDNPRALSAVKYAKAFIQAGIPAKSFSTVADAVGEAYSLATAQNTHMCSSLPIPTIALGSFYIYRQVKQAVLNICHRKK